MAVAAGFSPSDHLIRRSMRRQVLAMLGIVAAVVYVDQLSKAWAWRHLAGVEINSGGDLLVSTGISAMLRNPVMGAVLDVVDAMLLLAALLVLTRRRRPLGVLTSASLLLAGWVSNLGDRLGLHYWTAPGSVRGAVDFVPFAGYSWNLADVAIIVGSGGLAAALLVAGARAVFAPTHVVSIVRRPLARPGARAALVAAALGVAVLAVIGATAYGYGDSPATVLAARGR